MSGGDLHYYEIALTSGQYLHLIVDQRGIDVVISVFGPDRKPVCKIDRPSGSRGPEGVSVVARASGPYRFQISSLQSIARGSYEIRVDELRVARPGDDSRMVAERAVTEGEQLRASGTAESLQKAAEKLEQGLALWRAFDEPYEQAVASYALGLSYRSTAEYQKAISSFGQALLLMRKLGDTYGEAVAQTGLGWSYLYLDQNERALKNFSQALSLRRSIQDRNGEAFDLFGIGWANALMSRNDKALENFFQSLMIRQTANDRKGEALTLAGIGNIYGRFGKNLEALDYLNRALKMSRELNDCHGESNTLAGLGWIYISLKEPERSLDYFKQSLALRKKTGDRAGEATTLFGIAVVESQRGNLLAARAEMEPALRIIESLRGAGASQQLRISYSAAVQEYYEFYIDLLMRLDRLYPSKEYARAALEVNERARARGLLDLLAEASADIRNGVDPSLLETERELQRQLNRAADRQRQLLRRKHTEDQAAAVAQEIEALTAQHDDVLAQMRESSPRYAELAQPQPLTFAGIQQLLDPDTILLEYALGKERSYLWVVTAASISSVELPARGQVEAAARRVRELLTARNLDVPGESTQRRRARAAQADAEYSEAAGLLSRMLLGPVAAQLGTSRLAIVSQGALQLVPFGALPAPAPNSRASKDAVPLIVEHDIVNLPSVSTLALLRREIAHRTPALKMVAVLADPVFSRDDDRVQAVDRGSDKPTPKPSNASEKAAVDSRVEDGADVTDEAGLNHDLPRLSSTGWEADEIVSLVPPNQGMKLVDFDANREPATLNELGRHRFVHFATHAFVNDEHPELSGIVLSMVKKDGSPRAGFLRAHEIFNLTLPVDLVVLSGCRTALGKDLRGEGLLGMTRAFMYAGAPRVVVSQWSVNDRASAQLMAQFYRRMITEGLSPAAALRAAQVAMYRDKRWRSAYYWASFVLQGDWR